MNYNEFEKIIKEKFLTYLKIELTDTQVKKFFDYMNFLISENKKYNLTAITDEKDIIIKHFLDSAYFFNAYAISKRKDIKIIDIGTGAGFPAIPIAIINQDFNFTLVDSLNKRINFLKQVIEMIDLKNVSPIHSRAEDLARDKNYREKFDISIARAVSKIAVLCEYISPFLKVNGEMLLYKMKDSEEELNSAKNAFKVLNLKLEKFYDYDLNNENNFHRIYTIKKYKETSIKYPRKAGTVEKDPL